MVVPEPLSRVMKTSSYRAISRWRFLRLRWRAPLILVICADILTSNFEPFISHSQPCSPANFLGLSYVGINLFVRLRDWALRSWQFISGFIFRSRVKSLVIPILVGLSPLALTLRIIRRKTGRRFPTATSGGLREDRSFHFFMARSG